MNSERYKAQEQQEPWLAVGLEQMTLRFSRMLDLQDRLCDELETIADKLPDAVDAQFVLTTAHQVLSVVKCAHEFEERLLFPMMETRLPQLSATLERLRFEHWGDEEFAVDIHYALREFIRLRDKAKVEALSWMLRGFFDALRRHVAFDREYILPKIESAP